MIVGENSAEPGTPKLAIGSVAIPVGPGPTAPLQDTASVGFVGEVELQGQFPSQSAKSKLSPATFGVINNSNVPCDVAENENQVLLPSPVRQEQLTSSSKPSGGVSIAEMVIGTQLAG